MKIDVLTLFPDMFEGVLNESILKRAIDEKKVEVNLVNFRDYTKDPHNKVDDTPYGGGAGMVLTCQPIFDCVKALRKDNSKAPVLKGVVVKDTEAYEFLNKYATKLNLKPLEKNYFINRFMNVLQENKTSLVNIEINDENKTYDDVTIISNVDNFRYVKVTINKVDSKYKSSTEEIEIPKADRKGLSVILVSGLD